MQEPTGDDKGANRGGDGSFGPVYANTVKPIGELLGAAKRNAAAGVDEGSRDGTVNPRRVWTAERRARFEAARAAKRASAGQADAESVLEVKGEPEPEKPAPKPSKEDVAGWAGLLYMGHIVIAAWTKIPELRLAPGESEQLSVASMNVMRHYSNVILSEKSQDWIKLLMCMSMIYPTKLSAVGKRKRAERAAKMQPQGMTPEGGVKMAERPPEAIVEPTPQFAPDGAGEETIQ